MILVAASLAGVLLFAWPFLGLGFPADAPAMALALGAVSGLAIVEAGTRRLDARRLALLAALAALDSALRLVFVTGVAGFSPIFFLVLCAGYVFGPTYGFLVGATSLLISALVTGGVGPWVPYEMFGVAWVGAAAGVVGLRSSGPPTRRDVLALATVGAVLGLCYGLVLDVWDWTTFRGDPTFGWSPGMPTLEALHRFAHFYLATSLAYDSFRAVGNALMVLALGRPVLVAMRRFQRRFSVEMSPASEPAAVG
jgi:energy-coupling factor transport system substrate-specific component